MLALKGPKAWANKLVLVLWFLKIFLENCLWYDAIYDFSVWLRTDSNPADINRYGSHTGELQFVLEERSNLFRLKETMRVMGLENSVHWISWFIDSFGAMFISCVFLTIILVVSFIRYSFNIHISNWYFKDNFADMFIV